jgi:hypothetical protein
MKGDRLATNSPKMMFLPGLIAASLFLASCSAQSQLPQGAMDELEEQWQNFATDTSPNLRITRAWPSEVSAQQLAPSSPSMETWCVEVQPSAGNDGSRGPEPMIWIVTSADEEATWFAAPLMTMSSLWPYTACGVVP